MLTGWVAFLLAWVSTVLFYKTHPSGVESGTSQKLFLYVFGKKKYLYGYKGEKLETIQSNNWTLSELSNTMEEVEEDKEEKTSVARKMLSCCCNGMSLEDFGGVWRPPA